MQIAFSSISKSFGSAPVLHDVSFVIQPGQIFALLGENGAGKSTLMNILGGLFPPTAGQVVLDGAPVSFSSPNDSIDHGIAFIHQELTPVNDLRVYENMFLGRELRTSRRLLDRKAMAAQARDILTSLDVPIAEDMFMRDLDASHKQIVEISRALLCHAKAIIMDEPTTSLAGHEIERLFALVRKLSSQGVTIIFISHKLNEVKELCTDYGVLRNGALVATGKMADTDTATLSELIVGHELAAMKKAATAPHGIVMMQAQGLTDDRYFRNVSFAVKAGEILGITGLLGDGRSELFRSIFGDMTDFTGELLLQGKPFRPRSTADAVGNGIAYVPSNRKENAIIPDLSVLTNGTLATLKQYVRALTLRTKPQLAAFNRHAAQFRIKFGDVNDMITTLSGGNQQKVILTRWLNANPRVLILDNPTQGVDIGAKQDIYDCIRNIAAAGVAVIVLSGEGQEIVRLCERAIVMFHGAVQGELTGDGLTEQAIMKLATGIK